MHPSSIAANTRYYVIDGLGHVRALVAPNGAITEVWHYDSWGNPISPPAQRIDQPFLWNGAYGYEYIPFMGLYHFDPHGKGARVSINITVQKNSDGTCEVQSPVVTVGETVGTGYMASGYRGFANPTVGFSVTELSGGGKLIHVLATVGNPFYGELSNWSFPIVINFSFVIDRYGRIHSLEGSHTWYPAIEMYAYWGEVGTSSHRFLPCYLYSPDGSPLDLLSPVRRYFTVKDLGGRRGFPMSFCRCGN